MGMESNGKAESHSRTPIKLDHAINTYLHIITITYYYH